MDDMALTRTYVYTRIWRCEKNENTGCGYVNGGILSYSGQLRAIKGNTSRINIPDKKRNAPLRTVQLPGRSQVIGQFNLYQCKGMSGTVASHVFCKLASKLC